ncbi:YfiR family protein [Thiolapillus sp.]
MNNNLPKLLHRGKNCFLWKFKNILLTVSMVLLSMPLHVFAGVTTASEYDLKAALLYKLTLFIAWPHMDEEASSGNFNICLLGRDDFGQALDSLSSRKVNGMPIAIHRFTDSKAINKPCQLLFISSSKQPFMPSIIESLGREPMLTVSDAPDFAQNGGMIQFVAEKKHVGFRINLQQALSANLRIAAPLLELATIVSTKPQKDKP